MEELGPRPRREFCRAGARPWAHAEMWVDAGRVLERGRPSRAIQAAAFPLARSCGGRA